MENLKNKISRNKTKIFIFSLLPISLLIEFGALNREINYDTRAASNPYLIDDTSSVNMVEGSETKTSAKFELDVQDNANSDFYHFVSANEGNFLAYISEGGSNPTVATGTTFLDTEGDPDQGEFVFHVPISADVSVELTSIASFGLAIGSDSNPIANNITFMDDASSVTDSETEIYIPEDQRTAMGVSSGTTDFSYITPDSGSGISPISVSDPSSDSVMISIHISNAEYWTAPDTLDVSLTNTDINPGDDFRTESFQAAKMSESNGTYNYQIVGLDEANYQIYSINNTGLTVGDSSSNYSPDSTIVPTTELSMNVNDLLINNKDNAYINNDSFTLLSDSVTGNSIEFTLKVYESADNDFYNNLKNNGYKIGVTLDQTDSEGNTTTVQKEAKATTTNKPSDDTYTFKILDLEMLTDYVIISLDNTTLSVGSNINPVDDEITLNGSGGIYVDPPSRTFTTTDFIPKDGSSNVAAIVIPIVIIFLLLILIIVWYLYHKKQQKENKEDKILTAVTSGWMSTKKWTTDSWGKTKSKLNKKDSKNSELENKEEVKKEKIVERELNVDELVKIQEIKDPKVRIAKAKTIPATSSILKKAAPAKVATAKVKAVKAPAKTSTTKKPAASKATTKKATDKKATTTSTKTTTDKK